MIGAALGGIVTGLTVPADQVVEIARAFFVLFLIVLIAAGVRSMMRAARRHF
jgi:hypothetical protein